MTKLSHAMKAVGLSLLFFFEAAVALPPGGINVNEASAEELAASLAGVGQARAEAIVEYRQEHGDFVDLDELMAVRGVGEHVIKTNRDKIFFTE
ncbi:MAG: helix-hairpin-helix domain-containing protein [Pseudomonadales bacterium]|nr:helix-hairpin-helix domain-containing protein [Pseudomonadales bacterium]